MNEKNVKVVPTSEATERKGWGRPLEFILACLGYAVGLGNVWRFPYLCYRNGGGAFLIPFFLMLVLIGLPIFYLELYIGQYTALGPLKAFSSIAPFFSGLGYCTLMVISLISIYYMIIVAWTAYYTFISIGGDLAWGSCENDFNTDLCYSGAYDQACRVNNTGTSASDLTYFMRRCMSIGEICQMSGLQPYDAQNCWNGTQAIPWFTNINRVLASEEYYNQQVLGRGDSSWENWGSIQWHLVGCLFFCWVIAFLCVIKGVQSAGKVVYFTALFPYVMMTALIVRGVTLEGAGDGILFYLLPDWEILLTARVWGDAASQIFYSFGVACGSLITLASYNKFTNNCQFDAIFVCLTNFMTSIYAGFAIFSVLGFQALQMGVSVHDVAEEGPGLAFVAYPEALLQMPIPRFWSIMFFFMLFILGLGCQFAGIEAINTAILDQWPSLRKRYWMVTAGTCFTCFLLGIPMCFSGGVYLFTLLDQNTASWAILLIGMAECTAVSWSYGIGRAMRDLAAMNMKLNVVMRTYWRATWTVTVPVASIVNVAEEGPGLAFVAYPEALLQMPIPRFWSIMFFFMLFILGLGCQFAGIEAINTAILDQWPSLRKRYWMVTAGTCFTCFLLGIPMCFSGGVYLFTLLDQNTASWAILLIGMAECTAVSWSYGIGRAMRDLAAMNMKLNVVMRTYWRATWTVTVPVASISVLVFVFTNWVSPGYEDYVFPLFADLLGWAIGLSTLMFFPVGVVWALKHGYRGKELFTPTSLWKPAMKTEETTSDESSERSGYENIAYVS